MRSLFIAGFALNLAMSAFCSAEEIHEEFRRLAASSDGKGKREFVQKVTGERQLLTKEINAVLSDGKASIFAQVFALKVAESTAARGALDAALPFVGVIDSGLAGAQRTRTDLVGARALVAMGHPADDRLIDLMNGKETPEAVYGIAYVLVALNGRQRAAEKLEHVQKDPAATDGKRSTAIKVLDSMPSVIVDGEDRK